MPYVYYFRNECGDWEVSPENKGDLLYEFYTTECVWIVPCPNMWLHIED